MDSLAKNDFHNLLGSRTATTAFFAGAQIASIAYDRGWPPIVYRDDEVQGIRLEVPEADNVVRLEVVDADPGTSARTTLPDKVYVLNNDRGTRS